MIAFIMSFVVSAVASYCVFMAIVPNHYNDWSKMRDDWQSLYDVATFYGLTEQQTAILKHIAYCDRHIAFWSQPLWARMLWRNYPKGEL